MRSHDRFVMEIHRDTSERVNLVLAHTAEGKLCQALEIVSIHHASARIGTIPHWAYTWRLHENFATKNRSHA